MQRGTQTQLRYALYESLFINNNIWPQKEASYLSTLSAIVTTCDQCTQCLTVSQPLLHPSLLGKGCGALGHSLGRAGDGVGHVEVACESTETHKETADVTGCTAL